MKPILRVTLASAFASSAIVLAAQAAPVAQRMRVSFVENWMLELTFEGQKWAFPAEGLSPMVVDTACAGTTQMRTGATWDPSAVSVSPFLAKPRVAAAVRLAPCGDRVESALYDMRWNGKEWDRRLVAIPGSEVLSGASTHALRDVTSVTIDIDNRTRVTHQDEAGNVAQLFLEVTPMNKESATARVTLCADLRIADGIGLCAAYTR